MNLEEAISTVREFMGSYTGNHGDAMRIIVAEVERRKTVRSAVQERKAEIPPCQGCKGYGIACVQGAFRGGRICARERAKHSAVA